MFVFGENSIQVMIQRSVIVAMGSVVMETVAMKQVSKRLLLSRLLFRQLLLWL